MIYEIGFPKKSKTTREQMMRNESEKNLQKTKKYYPSLYKFIEAVIDYYRSF